MSKSGPSVIAVSLYALFFQLAILMNIDGKILFFMLLLSPFLMGWMVYSVLRFGKAGNENFNHKFYEDHPYIRNGNEETVIESEDLFSNS